MACNKLTQGIASTGHILLGNDAVNYTKGPTPTFALSYDPDLHPKGPDPVVHGGHTLETTLRGCILKCTRVRAQCPLSLLAIAETST